jgi:hypothetical protein
MQMMRTLILRQTLLNADEDESAGSASQQITDDETVQEDTLDMDTSQHTEEIENLNPVRRSTRERRQPSSVCRRMSVLIICI